MSKCSMNIVNMKYIKCYDKNKNSNRFYTLAVSCLPLSALFTSHTAACGHAYYNRCPPQSDVVCDWSEVDTLSHLAYFSFFARQH